MRVALLGTGLIGGSIGLALRRLEGIESISCFDRDASAAAAAVERGAADRAAASAEAAVAGADVVFVATPVSSIAAVVREAALALADGVVVTDVGSTKSRVVIEVERSLPEGATFVGGHPMAGTEEEGIGAAKASLFDGSWWILTPTPRVEAHAYQRLHSLISSLGAQVLALDPDRHDELLAVISHLPHLTATTLMNMAAERGREHQGLLSLAAGGFRDVTRVAASNPAIWLDICAENAEAIVAALEEFSSRLSSLAAIVRVRDAAQLQEQFVAARGSRKALTGKRAGGELVEVSLPVPDRPGVLADVTTTVGALGINIEDIQIVHAEEGGRGTLRLLVLGTTDARRVATALSERGFEPRSTSL